MEDLELLFSVMNDSFEEGGEEEEYDVEGGGGYWSQPIYETSPPQQLTQHWIFSIPTKVLSSKWRGFSLGQVLKSSQPHKVWSESDLQEMAKFSEVLTKLRRKLIENPLQSDATDFVFYLALIKRVNHYFYNNASSFDNPLSSSMSNNTGGETLILYEYLNFLLLTIQKYYHTYLRGINTFIGVAYGKDQFQVMTICQSLLEEVRRIVYQIMARQELGPGSKWECHTPPVAISSTDHLPVLARNRVGYDGETDFMRHYVKVSLCGEDSIKTRLELLQIKKNEIRIAMALEHISGMDALTRSEVLYERLVPWMRNITISYELLIKKNQSSHNYMVYYTSFMSFYWVLMGDYKLAEVDWECYQLEKYLDFDKAGNQSLKRLQVALEAIQIRESSSSSSFSMAPDYNLQNLYDTLKNKIKTLESTIRPILEISLGYSSGSVSLKSIEQKHFDSSQIIAVDDLLDTIYSKHAASFDGIFLLFERLQNSSSSSTLQKEIVKEELVEIGEEEEEEEEVVVDDSSLLEERKGWLEFLLDRKDKRGEIHINTRRVRELEDAYEKVMEKSTRHVSSGNYGKRVEKK